MAVEISKIINPNDPLLARSYEDVVVPLFPNPDKREGLEDFQAYLRDNERTMQDGVEYVYLVATHDGNPVGMTAFGVFCDDVARFIKGEFTGVTREGRKQRAFTDLLEEKIRVSDEFAHAQGYPAGIDLNFVPVREQEDEDSTISAKALVRLWQSYGFRKVHFPFYQLPVVEGHKPYQEGIYVCPLKDELKDKKSFSEQEMKRVVDAFNFFRNSDVPLEKFAEYHSMMDALKQEENRRIGNDN